MRLLLLLMAGAFSSAIFAQTCLDDAVETTPDGVLSILSETEILHDTTGLVWQRCAAGQTWDGTNCTGEATKYDWQSALLYAVEYEQDANEGWRLPNVKELSSITERNCVRPAIDTTFFPDTPPDDFWTSTPSLSDPLRAWVVAFFNSSYSIKEKDKFVYVRLVRTKLDSE